MSVAQRHDLTNMARVLKFFQHEMRDICPRDFWQKPTTAVTFSRAIGFGEWSVRQCRWLHDRPVQWGLPNNGLRPLFVGEYVPKKEGDEHPIVEWTQMSPRSTNAE